MASSKKLRLCKVLEHYAGYPKGRKMILKRFNHGEDLDKDFFQKTLDSYSDILQQNSLKSDILIQILKANSTLKEFDNWVDKQIQRGIGGRLQRGCRKVCCTEPFLRDLFGI